MSQPAARKNDPIEHTSLLGDLLSMGGSLLGSIGIGWALTTLAEGAVLAGLAALEIGTGGLATPLVIGIGIGVAALMEGSGLNEKIDDAAHSLGNAIAPPEIKGYIDNGSPNVYVNGENAARAAAPSDLDTVHCDNHSGPQMIAQGSDCVFINGQPAARVKDKTTCDADIAKGSDDVFYGGGTLTVREIHAARKWVAILGAAIGIALALCGRGKMSWSSLKSALPCLAMNLGAGLIGGWIGSKFRTMMGHPVNVITGGKILDGEHDTDFVLPGALPIVWRRFYSSHDDRADSLFGPGWSVPISVELKLVRDADGNLESIAYHDEQGRETVFPAVLAGTSHFSVPEATYLICTSGGHYVVETTDGFYRDFGPAHTAFDETLKLRRFEDRNGNWIEVDYEAADGAMRPARLQDSCGRTLRFVHVDGMSQRIAAIELVRGVEGEPAETLVSYAYTDAGELASVTDRTGQTTRRFAYEHGLMTSHVLPGGLQCFYAWQGTGKEARVVRHWTDDGESYVFDADVERRTVTVTDQLGRVMRWEWNEDRQPTACTDAEGHVWRLEWNDLRQLVSATDPNGGVTRFKYDDLGRLVERIDALGAAEKTEWNGYFDLPVAETDAANHRYAYRHDDRGNLTVAIDPAGGRTEYHYDERGLVHTIRDARGGYKHLEWNRRAQLTAYTDCSNKTTRLVYDARGALARITDAAGNATAYEADPIGRVTAVVAADGARQAFRYDTVGRLVEVVDANQRSTRYELNPRGLLTARTDAAGRVVRFGYDGAYRIATLTNENRENYRFAYDRNDQVVRETGLDGIGRTYEYDACGHGIRTTDAVDTSSALVTAYERDALGRVVAKDVDGLRWLYVYSNTGQLKKAETWNRSRSGLSLQNRVELAYGPRGEVTGERGPMGALGHRYDELGNRVATALQDGRTINWLYYGSGHLHQINLDGMVVTDIERDDLHREISRTQGKLASRYGYDAIGRRTAHDVRAVGASFESNEMLLQKQWQYDPVGEVLKKTHLLHGETRYRYDATGRIEQAVGNGVPSEVFRWDAAANLVSSDHPGGYVEHNRLRMFEDKRFEYDVYGRLSRKLCGHGPRKDQQFVYDAAHRLTQVRTVEGNGISTVRFEYDALGRRIRKTNGYVSTDFVWDGMRLLQERRGDDEATYLYEPDSYVPLARIDSRPAEAANDSSVEAAPENVYYFHNDVSGLPEELTDAEGRLVWQAQYKVWGSAVREEWILEQRTDSTYGSRQTMPTARSVPLPQNLRFEGQYLDRETGLHYNTFRFYDPDVGRFINEDPISLAGGFNLYQYAPNPLVWIDPWGWACIKNKEDGLAREARAKDILEQRYGKENVLSERYLRDANGKSVKDPITGERRRVDFVVKGQDGVWRPVEITSQTAPKFDQLAKELRIREMGGTFAKNPNTGEIIPVDGVSRVIRAR
ncbi:RHS repeat-associated core domain-containing protein [Paraburkholderia flava]|uniref:RHS repeat-associated core domain-containing protein n=1 Tax=Paraburkholderia flava TaxID=2547393 RepID=UPI0010609BE4|nr:RHS repeat-associated core domain-containing protein [Paraburkholderia flava]